MKNRKKIIGYIFASLMVFFMVLDMITDSEWAISLSC